MQWDCFYLDSCYCYCVKFGVCGRINPMSLSVLTWHQLQLKHGSANILSSHIKFTLLHFHTTMALVCNFTCSPLFTVVYTCLHTKPVCSILSWLKYSAHFVQP